MKFKKISDWIYQKSTNWVALISLIIFLAFIALVLPEQSAQAAEYSAAQGSPDLSLFYSGADLYKMAGSYGEAGRQAYIHARFTFDLAWPLVYGVFLSACLSWLLDKKLPGESRWRLLNLLPLAAVVFDLFENTAASLVIGRYPIQIPLAALSAPIFTFAKWVFVGSSFVLLFILLALFIFRRKK